MKTTKSAIFTILAALAFAAAALATPSAWATTGEDDRFYVRNSKWTKLLNGVVSITDKKNDGVCSGFLLEGDVIITAAHCLSDKDGYLKENGAVNFEKLKKLKVYFKDSNFISEGRAIFRERSKAYSIKDIFVGANYEDCKKGVLHSDFSKDDFAFIKLNEIVPKKYKRFKMLKDIDLNQYEILDQKHQKGLSISTAGYHGDIESIERLAHIGCRVRDSRQHEGVWFFHTDCDTFSGASGSPAFKILRHKRTGKVELVVLGVFISSLSVQIDKDKVGSIDHRFKTVGRDRRRYNKPGVRNLLYLASQPQYHFYSDKLRGDMGQYSRVLSLNNHLFFNEMLEGFKKDSSQWRNYKVPFITKHDRLRPGFFEKKIKPLTGKKLMRYLQALRITKNLSNTTCAGSILQQLVDLRESGHLKNKQREILREFFEEMDLEFRENTIKILNSRRKSLSYKNIMEAYGVSFLEEDGEFNTKVETPLENPRRDKRNSDRLWYYYFGR